MPSPELKTIQDALFTAKSTAPADLPDLAIRRAGVDAMAGWGATAEGVRVEPRPHGVPGVRITPDDAASTGSILYLHGGGYFGGSHRSHLRLVTHLVSGTGRAAELIDYRLAPEHPAPAAVLDSVATYAELVEAGQRDVVLIGDSAGGGLALATALRIRDEGMPPPLGVAMMSPWLDLSEHREALSTDPVCSANGLNWNRRAYAEGNNPRDPYISPIFGDLAGLPPLYIQVDRSELLWRDTARLNDILADNPGALLIHETTGLIHTFQLAAGVAPEADDAVASLVEWIAKLEQHSESTGAS